MNSSSDKVSEPVFDTTPFNPLDTENLGNAIAKALLEKRSHPLSKLQSFPGAGIYALYYHGDFEAYQFMAAVNKKGPSPQWPIYVGKAIPRGGRKGFLNDESFERNPLYARLRKHAASVDAAQNLRVNDFTCRFLVLNDLWIPLGERLLITKFAPLWNLIVEGFGNNNPGKHRASGIKSRWDLLHAGRSYAAGGSQRQESTSDIEREVRLHLLQFPVPSFDVLSGNLTSK